MEKCKIAEDVRTRNNYCGSKQAKKGALDKQKSNILGKFY